MTTRTAAEGLVFIKVQVKPEGHCIQYALCYHIELQDVVTPPALPLPLEEVLEDLTGLCEGGVG